MILAMISISDPLLYQSGNSCADVCSYLINTDYGRVEGSTYRHLELVYYLYFGGIDNASLAGRDGIDLSWC